MTHCLKAGRFISCGRAGAGLAASVLFAAVSASVVFAMARGAGAILSTAGGEGERTLGGTMAFVFSILLEKGALLLAMFVFAGCLIAGVTRSRGRW